MIYYNMDSFLEFSNLDHQLCSYLMGGPCFYHPKKVEHSQRIPRQQSEQATRFLEYALEGGILMQIVCLCRGSSLRRGNRGERSLRAT